MKQLRPVVWVYLILLPLMFSCNNIYVELRNGNVTGPGSTFIASDMTLGDLIQYHETLITLNYAGPTLATSCVISELVNLIETTPCSCSNGVCTVGITASSENEGAAGFNYTVTSDGMASNKASANLNILAATPFVSVWQTDIEAESNPDQIILPLVEGSKYNFKVDWGDGTTNTITSWNDPAKTHTYATPGIYTVSIKGKFERLAFPYYEDVEADYEDYLGDNEKIIDISSWGNNQWAIMEEAFSGCYNLTMTATDAPDLSNVTSMKLMFEYAEMFNGNISNWNTSNVTTMEGMFKGAQTFNQDISEWDTSNVRNMEGMFSDTEAFNQNIGNWNTSKVTTMSYMFASTVSFNQAIGNWDTSNVTDMSGMFSRSDVFNQDIGNWNTSNVINMSGMFRNASAFNQNIGNWNTSNVTDMSEMFMDNVTFTQFIGNWNTSNVTNMRDMFRNGVFNQDIGNWNTSNVTNMSTMFYENTAFNQDIGNWDTSKVTDMSWMFTRTVFNQNIGSWNTSNVTDMSKMFYEADAFNQDIRNWDTSKVTDMNWMFAYNGAFNQNLSGWNVDNVSDSTMFSFGATSWVLPKPTF